MSASSSSKVSIPSSVKKTIQELKDIVKNHSDEEIHAMLKDCDMDPNETVQRLLNQDPFHEVKRKRYKRKENIREPVDGRLKPAPQGRVGRGSRGNYSSRNISHDASGGKNIKNHNGIHQTADKGIKSSSSPPSQHAEVKSTVPSSSVSAMPNGPSKIKIPVQKQQFASKHSNVSVTPLIKVNENIVTNKMTKASTGDTQIYKNQLPSQVPASNSDPVLESPIDAHIPTNVGTIKREVGKQRVINKHVSTDSSEKVQGKLQGVDGNQVPDASQATHSLSRTSSAGSRPSSNYGNRSQQLNGPQKVVGPAKEWKPKSTMVKPSPASQKLDNSDAEPKIEVTKPSSMSSEEPIIKLQNKLEALQISDIKHVIIPNHLQVSESERTGLSFGSFDANFGLTTGSANDFESMKGSTEISESTEEVVEEESTSSPQIASAPAQEVELADHSLPSTEVQEITKASETEVLSNVQTAPVYDQSKTEAVDISQHSAVQTAPTYSNFGLVPQMIGNQFASLEGSEPQARDSTRSPSFLQPFDPANSYYASMYRPPVADCDGRFSPIYAPPAPATKYLPGQTGQAHQECGISSTGSTTVITQAPGMLQSSVSQQSVPVFRQPPGVHLSHFPPNYLPYNQYFSPFYIPSPSMHPFLSNATFPQQPQPGNIYPSPGPTGAAPVKYISQYKPTTNVSNPSHMVIPTGGEDLASSRYKDNNVYAAGQQSEASVWIPTPGRDISAMQPTSFYNLPPTPGQPITFPAIYHHATQTAAPGTIHPMLQPSQTMAGPVEMVGPPAVYQQPQRSQINWVNNY